MEVKLVQPCSWMNADKMIRKPTGFARVPQRAKERGGVDLFLTLQTNKKTSARCEPLMIKVSSSLKDSPGYILKSDDLPDTLDKSLILKNKSEQIEAHLEGRSIYLVGMMGSGKTTIGKVLAQALGYSFFDSDSLVETHEGMSVAEMFDKHGEGFFREIETMVLKEVSTERHLVISTGGGAVIRPVNWKHMRSGVSVWLDVPIDCLARRISAVGTSTRPLLHGEPGDAYTKAYTRLSKLYEKRHKAYENANARVSFENIARKVGNVHVDDLCPTTIAIEVLNQIESFIRNNDLTI